MLQLRRLLLLALLACLPPCLLLHLLLCLLALLLAARVPMPPLVAPVQVQVAQLGHLLQLPVLMALHQLLLRRLACQQVLMEHRAACLLLLPCQLLQGPLPPWFQRLLCWHQPWLALLLPVACLLLLPPQAQP